MISIIKAINFICGMYTNENVKAINAFNLYSNGTLQMASASSSWVYIHVCHGKEYWFELGRS